VTGTEGSPWWMQPPGAEERAQAATRLRGVLLETPLLESERLNDRLGGRVLVKAECLQHTGSFKARGAWNWLSQLDPAAAAGGIVALSSGNHGQAVAWAARRLGLGPVTILMPADAPAAKVARTRAWGAVVVAYDRTSVDRAALMRHWVEERRHVMVPAFDDRRIVAATSTIATEALAQAAAVGATPTQMVVACSGGGLAAGCALALAAHPAPVPLLAVEPEGFDDMGRSLAAGQRLANAPGATTICDALLSPIPGELCFGINHAQGTRAQAVPDHLARAAMAAYFEYFGLVVEPGGALPLAALLGGPEGLRGRTVLIVASGANTDKAVWLDAVSQDLPAAA